ncbi:MAG: leucine-rich repeat protein [Oscillospiraceae bacterium]|nr:leucine-rich repeat protein [Oscillospiraceae bacterium]
MGSSGKVVNLVVGKEVTTIGSQFQKSYIGTPTAKLSLTLEEGSKLSSVGNDAFKDNSFFVSIDLSNAGNVTFGTSAFNNVSNLTHFATNKGTLTLNTLAMGNLKKLQVLDWNASSTTLNWSTTLTATATFTSSQTTNSTRPTTTDTKTTSTTGTASSNGAGSTQNGSYYYPSGTVSYGASTAAASTITGNLSNSATATSTTTATYGWTGTDNTGNHPLYNLGASVSAGTTVNLNETVVSIPNYTFTTGIYAFETKAATLTNKYTATGSATFTSNTTTTSGTATKKNPVANGAAVYFGWRSNNWGWMIAGTQITTSSVGATSHNNTRTGTLTMTTTVTETCAITEGVKLSKPTGIKVGRVNSFSKKLTSIGQSAFGWIQIPITSANADLPTGAVTSSFTTSATATSTRSSTTMANPTMNYATSGHQYYVIYANYNGSGWTQGTSYLWTGTSYSNTATGKASYASGETNWYGYNSAAQAQNVGKTFFASKATMTANDSTTTSVTPNTITIPASATTKKVWSTVNNGVTAASAGTIPNSSVLKIANFGIMGPNATINSGAFIGAKVLEQVYLAGTVENIQAIVFNTRNTASTDKIYVYGKSAAGEFTTSTGLTANNDLGIEYRKDAKDLGRYINHYQIGTSVYAYLFETDPDKYLINIVGTGATYTNYTASNRPGWAASYANKVTQLIVDDTVTSVGPYLFYGHTALTTVQFGSGLTSIGAHAFGSQHPKSPLANFLSLRPA